MGDLLVNSYVVQLQLFDLPHPTTAANDSTATPTIIIFFIYF